MKILLWEKYCFLIHFQSKKGSISTIWNYICSTFKYKLRLVIYDWIIHKRKSLTWFYWFNWFFKQYHLQKTCQVLDLTHCFFWQRFKFEEFNTLCCKFSNNWLWLKTLVLTLSSNVYIQEVKDVDTFKEK